MEILLVTGHFEPEIHPRSFRATEIAKELVSRGHNVKVITLREIEGCNYPLLEKSLSIEIENLGVYRSSKDLGGYKTTGYVKSSLYKYFRFYTGGRLFMNAWRIVKVISTDIEYDYVISFSNPFDCHLGIALAKRFGKFSGNTKLIADYGDPFSSSSQEAKANYFKSIEKWVLKWFSVITIPFEGARAAYSAVTTHEKIRIIPQGFNFDTLNKRSTTTFCAIPRFVYAGLFYEDIRNPFKLFKYLNEMKEGFEFYIYLRYTQEWVVNMLRNDFPCLYNKVVLKVNFQRVQLLNEIVDFDFAVNLGNTTADQLPSKLIDYAICDLPICNIENELDIMKMRDFIKGDYTSRLVVDRHQYNIKHVVGQFLDI